jgi:hypothetical protein
MGGLFRLVIGLALVAGLVLFLTGYWGTPWNQIGEPDIDKARERGAELGERAAEATAGLRSTLGEAALTSKIKAKMALDDTIKARRIDVTTQATTVTLSGKVSTAAERERALALARETTGVTQVVDRLTIDAAR